MISILTTELTDNVEHTVMQNADLVNFIEFRQSTCYSVSQYQYVTVEWIQLKPQGLTYLYMENSGSNQLSKDRGTFLKQLVCLVACFKKLCLASKCIAKLFGGSAPKNVVLE